VRDISCRRGQAIEPMPLPYPWRRLAFVVAFSLASIAAGMLVAVL
jgi:hypothetical protein